MRESHRLAKSVFWTCVVLTWFLGSLFVFIGCAEGRVEQSGSSLVPTCAVSRARHPTTPEDFGRVYAGRTFYYDGVHLGRDIAYAEGTAIHPVACGVIRVYRSASGYGTLVVVIEHRLTRPIVARNGRNEDVTVGSFLTIYGHLRPTTGRDGGTRLPLREGDNVGPDDVIGYVEHRLRNGDGDEHLHLGVRLQTATEAQRTDAAWFRGYDASPSQVRWFADPADVLLRLMRASLLVRWHPPGTVLANRARTDEHWMVGADDALHVISPVVFSADRMNGREIVSEPEELACYRRGTPFPAELSGARVLRFADAPAVYEVRDGLLPERRAFVSHDAFLSWGWREADVLVRPSTERAAFLARYRDAGVRRLRDGTPVKGRGQSEVAIVSNGRRLPVADWNTLLAMGYATDRIVEVEPSVLDEVAFPRGPLITAELAGYCASPPACLGCDAGHAGGGGDDVEPEDALVPTDDVVMDDAVAEDANVPPTDTGGAPDVPIERDAAPALPDTSLAVAPDVGVADASALIMVPPDAAAPDVVVVDAVVDAVRPDAGSPAVTDAGMPERIVFTDPASADGRDLPFLRDWPGYAWYHLCATTPEYGRTSTHPWTTARPEALQLSPIGDWTLPAYAREIAPPPAPGGWSACAAFLLANAPTGFAEFNVRYRYGSNWLYAVGQNRADTPTIETNGSLRVFLVAGGRQSPVDTELVFSFTCDPSLGGRLHVLRTACSSSVCTTGTRFACHPS